MDIEELKKEVEYWKDQNSQTQQKLEDKETEFENLKDEVDEFITKVGKLI